MPPSTILGPDGRPMQRQALATPQATPTVIGVRPILSGHPASGLTPERLARLLRASEEGDATAYLELAEDMEERDLHYRGVLGTRKLSVAQLDVTVEAASDEAADQEAADLVREWLDSIEVEELLFDMADGLGKGFSAIETNWDTAHGRWWPVELEHRDPRWFQFDRTDGRTLRLVDGTWEGAELTPYKYVIHTPKTKSGLPIRGGLARAAAWAYLFKNYAIKDWVVFSEVYGHPLRLGKYGPTATPDEKDVLLQAVRDLGTDAAAIIPLSMAVELVSSSTSNVDLWEKLCTWMDLQVSKAVLGQTTTTDAVSGGHAVSQEHRQVQQDIERADARQSAGTLNRRVVPPLVSFNLGPRDAYPRIRIGRPDEEDVSALVEHVVKLVPLGLKVGMSTMRDKIGLPDPDEEEELLTAPGATPTPPAGQDPQKDPLAPPTAEPLATAAASGGDRLDLDAAIAAELAAEGWAMAGVIDPIRALLAGAASLEEVKARLADPDVLAQLLAAMDTAGIEEALTRAGFAAWLAGRTEGADA